MSDCLIIGGGVIGLMSARALSMAGLDVVLLDRRDCGQESSKAGGGILSPLYPWLYDDLTNELSTASQRVYPQLCADLLTDTGIDPQYLRSGLLMTDEFDTILAKHWLQRHPLPYQRQADGALFDNVAQVRNPRLLRALKADVLKRGVRIVEYVAVEKLLLQQQKVVGVKTTQQDFMARNVLICAGAWSSTFVGLTQPIFPIKGQMIVLKAPPDTLKHIILSGGRYLIPRKDGRILVGSTMENVGFDDTIDANTRRSLFKFAQPFLPHITPEQIEHHWAGFRPASKSGEIVLGHHPKIANLFINTGHFRNGLNTAPESARRITHLILNAN